MTVAFVTSSKAIDDAKAVILVKFMEVDGRDARPKNERNEAYSPNWMERRRVWGEERVALREGR